MSPEEYAGAMALVVSYWPHYRPSVETFKAGERLLLDLDFEPVVAAIDLLAVNEPAFAPGAGRIRAEAARLIEVDLPDADEAWGQVMAEVRRVGRSRGGLIVEDGVESTRDVNFTHPAIGQAVDSIGWEYLCDSTDPMADRAHFIRFYETAHRRAAQSRTLPPSVRSLAGPRLALGVPDEDEDETPEAGGRHRPEVRAGSGGEAGPLGPRRLPEPGPDATEEPAGRLVADLREPPDRPDDPGSPR